jgi:1-acyl-sn-glycerol-3-phosphate acyltransferase
MKNGLSIMMFPEGTRSRDGKIRPFKKGGFVMAIGSGEPIVPVVIKGTWPIMAKSSLKINSGDVTLQIERPIRTTDYTRATKEDLIESVRTVICRGVEEGSS